MTLTPCSKATITLYLKQYFAIADSSTLGYKLMSCLVVQLCNNKFDSHIVATIDTLLLHAGHHAPLTARCNCLYTVHHFHD